MKTLISMVLLSVFVIFFSVSLPAQDPPPPPAGGHGQGGNQAPGGSAPLGEGIAILMALGVAYASRQGCIGKHKPKKH